MADLNPVPMSDPWPPWPENLTSDRWKELCGDIRKRLLGILGEFPSAVPKPDPARLASHDCGWYFRIKLVYSVEADDHAPA